MLGVCSGEIKDSTSRAVFLVPVNQRMSDSVGVGDKITDILDISIIIRV